MEMNDLKKEEFYDEFVNKGALWHLSSDALEELAALKNLEKIVKERIAEITEEAIALAEEELKKLQLESGRFEHGRQVFELSLTKVFDFAGNPNRYTMEAGVQYRAYAREQEELKKQSEAKTKLMNALTKNFAAENPRWKPDEVKKVVKFIKSLAVSE